MTTVLLVMALACIAISGAFVLILRKLSTDSSFGDDLSWTELFSTNSYRPMARLLDPAELEYVKAQPGISRRVLRRWRAERRRIFRGYLRSMSRDFAKLNHAIKMLMVHSTQDRRDLAEFLLKQQVAFAAGLLRAEFQLVLHAAGMNVVSTDTLVRGLESMRTQLQALTVVSDGSLA